jgi:quinol-cytochrome oxidoreductase complex cytochrome b subunit
MSDDEPKTDGGTETRTDGVSEPDGSEARRAVRTDGGSDARSDGGGIVPQDDQAPAWSERKERTQGLSRLTYEYFERSRREDEDLRQASDYVERDVLAFPTWPHEMIRNLALTSFFVGLMFFISAAVPPHLPGPANANSTPAVILPDWYLYWSFGLLKLTPINPELALLGGEKLVSDRVYGVVANIVVVSIIAVVPFLNKGAARRPVEEPGWAALGVGGVVFAFTIAVLAVKNLVTGTFPISNHELFDVTFLLPLVAAFLAYAVLKTMREGYMFELNRRYFRLRPPK